MPSDSSNPWMAAMLAWFSDASTRASRSKRAMRSASCTTDSWSSLMATLRPRRVSVAAYTTPIPPSPSFDSTTY